MRTPRIAEALLRGFIADPDLEEAILGDLTEEWEERAESEGSGSADAWHARQVLTSVPHLLGDWWLRESPGRALRTLARVALTLLLAVSLAAATFVGMSAAGTGGPSGQPLQGDPHVLAIDVLLAGAVGAAAGGFSLAWRTSRAPMCQVTLLGLSWIPTTLAASAIFPSPEPPAWFLVVGPALLLALTVAGGGIATTLRRAGHREHDFLDETDPLNPETTMKTENTAFRLAARPLLAAAVLLTVPLVAMQFTDQVVWTLSDFVIMGGLVVGTGALFELTLMKTDDGVYRLAAGVALGAAFLLFWINGAVGIIGSADNDANMMYLGVLAVGIGGAVGAGFRSRGLARALFATALAQVAVGTLALVAGLGSPWHVVGLTGTFAALFVGAGLLFRRAARKQRPAVAAREG